MGRRLKSLAVVARRQWVLAAGLVILFGLVTVVPFATEGSTAPYRSASLQCRARVTAGQGMTVVGKRFPRRSVVTIAFDGVKLATATATKKGKVRVRVVVPRSADSGRHTITATTTRANATASCRVTVRRR